MQRKRSELWWLSLEGTHYLFFFTVFLFSLCFFSLFFSFLIISNGWNRLGCDRSNFGFFLSQRRAEGTAKERFELSMRDRRLLLCRQRNSAGDWQALGAERKALWSGWLRLLIISFQFILYYFILFCYILLYCILLYSVEFYINLFYFFRLAEEHCCVYVSNWGRGRINPPHVTQWEWEERTLLPPWAAWFSRKFTFNTALSLFSCSTTAWVFRITLSQKQQLN